MADKIYIVKSDTKTRLVQAINKSSALRHVAQSDYKISSASQTDLIKAVKDGVEVELSSNKAE